MQRHLHLLLTMAWSSLIMAQTAWPPLCIQSEDWTSGTHHTAVTQPIEAPCSPVAPLSSGGTADAEFVSGTEVHLMDGFHAGDFTGDGQFHAYIDDTLSGTADLVLIAPEPATHVVDNLVHVEKWEKLEVGLRLPQDYLNAVDSFFVHYYSNGTNNTATPGNVDTGHDLNPYADDSLQLVMTLTSPSGVHKMKWGFYMRETQWSSTSDTARLTAFPNSPLDAYRIRFRTAPDEEGTWQFSIAVHAPHTRTVTEVLLPSLAFSGYAFVCDPPLADNHGYLQVNTVNRRMLRFDDGTAFFGMGVNMADIRHGEDDSVLALPGGWYRCYLRDRRIMDRTMRQLHEVGGNYLRMSFRREVSALEWVNAGVYDSYYSAPPCNNGTGLRDSSNCQYFAWDFDRMLDSARLNDLYIQLNIEGSPPGGGGEANTWGNHPYVRNFLYPHRDPGTGQFDMKRFFFTPDSAGNPQYDRGVFYYWKRKFKYILSRWGYSVNLAVLEPFQEVDNLLGYGTQIIDSLRECCLESYGTWPADTALPSTVDNWYTQMAHYVRGAQMQADPAASFLGDSTKLLLVSYALSDPLMSNGQVRKFYRHFANPNIDLMDVHMYTWPDTSEQNQLDDRMKDNWNKVQAFQDSFPTQDAPLEARKPFNAGEVNYFTTMSFGTGQDPWKNQIEKVFHNYDVSFHNELWSGAFSGKFATGLTWFWERVFWWDEALPTPPEDQANQFQTEFTATLGSMNKLDIGLVTWYPDTNRTIHHNFKPLADMLADSDLVATNFFNENYTSKSCYNDTAGIESYYLMNDGGTMAVGWVHNLNAWTMNNYYLARNLHNFLGCVTPDSQSVSLPGFAQDHNFYITYFPTRMNATVPPNDSVRSNLAGEVILNLSSDSLQGIANNALDTLHSDYAFVIAPYPVYRGMQVAEDEDSGPINFEWDFSIHPNPAVDEWYISFSDDTPKDIVIYELSGRRMLAWSSLIGRTIRLHAGQLARGAYIVHVNNITSHKVKRLIIR